MSTKGRPSLHSDKRWQRLLKEHKPRLIALLPQPCPRCMQVMVKGMHLDMGHASRHPSLWYEPSNLRLEHRGCNRRDGQRITTAKRMSKRHGERMPGW